MPTKDELLALYQALSAPFPPEAIERTTAEQTGRGYNTTGIKVAYIIDRLNQVLGVGAFRFNPKIEVRERTSRSGRVMYEAVCELVLQLGHWEQGQFVSFAEASGVGGHVASLEADARKGSVSNAVKKAASIVGCGWQAFAGRLDDDHEPLPRDDDEERWGYRAHPRERRTAANRERSSNADSPKRTNGRQPNGRITNAQIGKLRELINETGADWNAYRTRVCEQHGVNLEYASTALASTLISELVAYARKRRANGVDQQGGRDERGR